VYCGSTSSTVFIVCSVPHGSVLGPRLFILYTADLADVAAKHDANLHSFADDTQYGVARWHCLFQVFLLVSPAEKSSAITGCRVDEDSCTCFRYITCGHGNIILVGAPKSVTNKLQRVLNAAAWIVTGTRKYDRGLSHLLHTELHWLDVPERVL